MATILNNNDDNETKIQQKHHNQKRAIMEYVHNVQYRHTHHTTLHYQTVAPTNERSHICIYASAAVTIYKYIQTCYHMKNMKTVRQLITSTQNSLLTTTHLIGSKKKKK